MKDIYPRYRCHEFRPGRWHIMDHWGRNPSPVFNTVTDTHVIFDDEDVARAECAAMNKEFEEQQRKDSEE